MKPTRNNLVTGPDEVVVEAAAVMKFSKDAARPGDEGANVTQRRRCRNWQNCERRAPDSHTGGGSSVPLLHLLTFVTYETIRHATARCSTPHRMPIDPRFFRPTFQTGEETRLHRALRRLEP